MPDTTQEIEASCWLPHLGRHGLLERVERIELFYAKLGRLAAHLVLTGFDTFGAGAKPHALAILLTGRPELWRNVSVSIRLPSARQADALPIELTLQILTSFPLDCSFDP